MASTNFLINLNKLDPQESKKIAISTINTVNKQPDEQTDVVKTVTAENQGETNAPTTASNSSENETMPVSAETIEKMDEEAVKPNDAVVETESSVDQAPVANNTEKEESAASRSTETNNLGRDLASRPPKIAKLGGDRNLNTNDVMFERAQGIIGTMKRKIGYY